MRKIADAIVAFMSGSRIEDRWIDCRRIALRGLRGGLLLGILALATACEEPSYPGVRAPQESASEQRIRLLTASQYHNTIAGVFGADVARAVVPPVPPLQRTDGLLASGAASVGLTSDQISQVQQAASIIAAKVVDDEHRVFLMACEPADSTAPDGDCAETFLRDTGRYLYRRPLDDEQLDALVAIAATAARETGDFYGGLALALEAMLISPEFLFIIDRVDADAAPDGNPRLDAYSLASRLSYFLWDGPPDGVLLDAAASGRLRTEAGLRDEVRRMLESSRVEAGVRAFFDDMLAFDEFDSLAKDAAVYPAVTGATLADAREQTLRTIVDHLLTRDGDYRDLFVTRNTFMSPSLAAVYGTPAGEDWAPHTFDDASHRRGLLTHVSFLAANSHAVRSSPTLRGKALRELLLCQHVPDPPPNVDFSKIEDAGDVATARERLKVHNENPSCAGCHLITDPMGLSLENFDGAGAYRESENGAAIDIAGELDGVFYDDIDGLAAALRDHPKLSACLVNRLYAYGTGGPVSLKYDRDILKAFENHFVMNNHRLPALLEDLATSEAFTHLRRPAEAAVEVAAGEPSPSAATPWATGAGSGGESVR